MLCSRDVSELHPLFNEPADTVAARAVLVEGPPALALVVVYRPFQVVEWRQNPVEILLEVLAKQYPKLAPPGHHAILAVDDTP